MSPTRTSKHHVKMGDPNAFANTISQLRYDSFVEIYIGASQVPHYIQKASFISVFRSQDAFNKQFQSVSDPSIYTLDIGRKSHWELLLWWIVCHRPLPPTASWIV